MNTLNVIGALLRALRADARLEMPVFALSHYFNASSESVEAKLIEMHQRGLIECFYNDYGHMEQVGLTDLGRAYYAEYAVPQANPPTVKATDSGDSMVPG